MVNPASPIKSIADLIAAAKAEPDKLSYGTFGTGTSAERLPAFPQLPTVAESGIPGYAAESWYGLFAPAGTPADIVDRLNKSAAIAVRSEAFRRLGVNEGLVMAAGPPEELEQRRGSALAQGDPGRGDQD